MRMLALLLVLTAYSGSLAAHEMKAALTKLVFNDRSGNIEVMHRFYVHDAEHGVKQLFDKSADLLNSEQTQQTFSRYVSEHFALTTLSGDAINLTLVGGQLEGRFFWVYQEAAIPAELQGLRIQHQALQALWPAQVNTVNIEGRGEVKSLRFDSKTGWQQLSF
ncbi:MAG: hypothetical protein KKE30_07170 [Gammaproteobacteria bacterium]|nr:hypothetical protein [Gammaproteobacteria bacterium]MBU1553907.1 hypothetical protein [Gammaproteobacteria bacterium]MBU2072436.1 hypothetical protein [Gammaproteobacteria bacterium]MBU2183310.1 hypothetical protein [Gammaproteobacteria bacterium]MBU2203206.1 hypothetical protein [Gammaproteobacteria bacterium]